MNIGDFARLGPVSPRMLRHYDQTGLLAPEHVDESSGYRAYSVKQLPRLHQILALRDLGFGIEEIRTLLKDEPSVEQLRGMLRLRQIHLETNIEAEQDQLRRVEAHLRAIERNTSMSTTNVIIKKAQPLRIAEMQDVAPGGGPANVGPIFGKLLPQLLQHLQQAGVTPGISVGYYEGPSDDGSLTVHVGFDIGSQPLENTDTVTITKMPITEVASVVHEGPIDEISSWYEDLFRWIEDSGRSPAGSARELYLAWDNNNSANNVTEIQIPIS